MELSSSKTSAENTQSFGNSLDSALAGKLGGIHGAESNMVAPSVSSSGRADAGEGSVEDQLYRQASACAVDEFQLMKPEALPLTTQGRTLEESAAIKRDIFNKLCAIVLVELNNLCYKNHTLPGQVIIVKDIVRIAQMSNTSLVELVAVLEYLSIALDKALARKGLAAMVGSVAECTGGVVAQLNSALLHGSPNTTPYVYAAGSNVGNPYLPGYGLNVMPVVTAGTVPMANLQQIDRLAGNAASYATPVTLQGLPQMNPGLFKLPMNGPLDAPRVVHPAGVPRQYIAERVTKRNMAYLFGSLANKPFPLFKKRKVGASVHVGLSKIPNGVRLISMHIFHRTIPKGSFNRSIKCFEDYNESINFKHGAIFTLVFESYSGTSQA